MENSNVYQKILDIAENLIQTQGYNAFSYRDIAEVVGVKTSSIHYYFPTKEDLGRAVVKQHLERLYQYLQKIITNPKISCLKKLDLFFDGIFAKTYHADRRMCLGGMLASDVLTLPESIQQEVRIFFKKIEAWVEELLLLGKKQKEFHLWRGVKEEAQLIVSLMEGVLLLSRLYQDEARLLLARKHVKARLLEA